MADRIPLVNYLVLDPEPHLVAQECTSCGARYFERRTACASCEAQEFRSVDVATTGEIASFTIVTFAQPGVDVPYVAVLVDADDGTRLRGNVVGIPADPEHVKLGQKVKLTTFPLGQDSTGVEAVGFGFTPVK